MRVVFMGSPEFAVPTLSSLAREYSIVAVVTQPDRPAGRGRAPKVPAAKQFADQAGIPVLQPDRLRASEAVEQVAGYRPDLIVVAAYGQILPKRVLDLPPHGCLNVHASLLPRWRGASPVQAAILHGDNDTGVSIMRMDKGLDTGPILAQRGTPLDPDETGGSLSSKLALLGADLLMEALPDYLAGELEPIPQDNTLATHAPLLRKSDGAINLRLAAHHLERMIRAYDPWPGSYLMWEDRRVLIRKARTHLKGGIPPGTILQVDRLPAVGTGQHVLLLLRVQPEGKREMDGQAFLRGAPEFLGARLLG